MHSLHSHTILNVWIKGHVHLAPWLCFSLCFCALSSTIFATAIEIFPVFKASSSQNLLSRFSPESILRPDEAASEHWGWSRRYTATTSTASSTLLSTFQDSLFFSSSFMTFLIPVIHHEVNQELVLLLVPAQVEDHWPIMPAEILWQIVKRKNVQK